MTGTLTSPNYPYNYPDYVDCYYYITVSTGYIIQLTVEDFCTEACCDFLTVRIEKKDLLKSIYYSLTPVHAILYQNIITPNKETEQIVL